jgi:hypothetical protein
MPISTCRGPRSTRLSALAGRPGLAAALVVLMTAGPVLSACGGDQGGPAVPAVDGRDDRFATGKADNGATVEEGSPQAIGVLALVNLDDIADVLAGVPITTLARQGIIAFRDGADGLAGTADDREFLTLAELDAVPYVGPHTLSVLVDAAGARGLIPAAVDGGATDAGTADQGGACFADGTACRLAADCCSGSCSHGLCESTECKGGGEPCQAFDECCSGTCTQGQCTGNHCQAKGQRCYSNDQCCDQNCHYGYCGGTTCLPDGTRVDAEADADLCCSNTTWWHGDWRTTGQIECGACTSEGQPCTVDHDCCGAACIDGLCGSPF